MEDNILFNLPTLNEDTPSADHLPRYPSMLGAQHGEFSRRFQNFRTAESEMHKIFTSFTCSVDKTPNNVQLELIDLQSDASLSKHIKSASLLDFHFSLKEENFPHTRRHGQRILVLFGSTYILMNEYSQ